jgi:hypothetical protein
MENPDDGTDRHHIENPYDGTERHHIEIKMMLLKRETKEKKKREAKE